MPNMKPSSLLGRFNKKMIDLGFTILGTGTNAVVYKSDNPKDKGIVIKAWEHDVGYMRFLKLVSEHPDNKYFPKIEKYAKVKHKDFIGLHFVRMEELKPIDETSFQHIIGPYIRYQKYKGRLGDPEYEKTLKENYEEQLENNEGFYKTLDLLYETPLGTAQLDLHSENIMRRPGGGWVIVDPFISFDGE